MTNHSPVKQNLVSLLEQVCQKKGKALTRNHYETQDGKHGVTLSFDEFSADAVSTSRKRSLNLASNDILMAIINSEPYNEYGLLGSTKEEARENVMLLYSELDQDEMKENWVGKNESFCTQNKFLTRPVYTYSEETIENTKRFSCKCTISDIVVEETRLSKKKAKNAVAKVLYEKLVNIKEQDALQIQPTTSEKQKDDEIPVNIAESIVEPIVEVNNSSDNIILSDVISSDVISPDVIFDLLKSRLNEDHLFHKRCQASELLLRKICALDDHPILEKMWPKRKLAVYLDTPNGLVELNNQIKIDQKQSYRVFLEIQDMSKLNRPTNLFMGNASSVQEAKELAYCRALFYLQWKFGVRK